LDFAVGGDPAALYARLRRAQRARHGAFICTGDWTVLSFSPELFFARDGDRLTCRPMKGTLARGLDAAADRAQRARLAADPKNRAENLMIVDLMRNDLARLALPGSVRVGNLFDVEALATVLQMTSTIHATIAHDTPLSALFRALFPCGSVTGAPKIRAMEIIAELEQTPRGVYTGAIGFAGPGATARFSVPIRTMVIDAAGRGRLGIGSGIVAESDVAAEYRECLLKARFLDADWPPFDLFETIGWTPRDGYRLIDEHLARLAASAAYFGFAFESADARRRLAEAAARFAGAPMRVKLSLSRLGHMAVEARLLPPAPAAMPTIGPARQAVDSRDCFLYHKTTRRGLYETERRHAAATHGWFDVVFENERGEITEGSFTTVFIERDGGLLTPALSCGLLPGVLRGALLRDKDVTCREAVLTRHDLATARHVYVGNALRGLIAVHWSASE
ncbi:MAG: aminodeoxychorismate synthase, component I, partial [Alphaproteobacteria bacterium]